MMYLLGTKEQRKAFEAENRIPWFEFEERTDPDTVMLHGKDDESATLIVNLDGDPLYTVQVMGEEGGIESETDYQDYNSALAAYEAIQAHGARGNR